MEWPHRRLYFLVYNLEPDEEINILKTQGNIYIYVCIFFIVSSFNLDFAFSKDETEYTLSCSRLFLCLYLLVIFLYCVFCWEHVRLQTCLDSRCWCLMCLVLACVFIFPHAHHTASQTTLPSDIALLQQGKHLQTHSVPFVNNLALLWIVTVTFFCLSFFIVWGANGKISQRAF